MAVEEGTAGSVGNDGCAKSLAEGLGCLALLAVFFYALIFFIYPMGYAFSDKEPGFAVDIIKWNLTHFPPSQGPAVRCVKDALETPAAEALAGRALSVGRELEVQQGYNITKRTRIGVFHSLSEHAGVAHYAGGDNCIQLKLNSYGLDDTIRHEWAHIAAEGEAEYAAHGPKWREIAQAFGAETAPYRHCAMENYDCQPIYRTK